MAEPEEVVLQRGLDRAFRLCAEAMDVLDSCGAPPEISPHLDLALNEIRSALSDLAGPNPDD